MLFDPVFLVEHLEQVLLLVLAVVLGKGVLFAGVTRAFGYHSIIPIAAALTMSQIGEFSFLLAQLGRSVGAVGEELYAVVVATTVVTMLLTPYLARLAAPMYRLHDRLRPSVAAPLPREIDTVARPVVIAGGGRVGRRLARILTGQQIPFVLIEFDQGRMQISLERGWPVVFGDAAQDAVLRAAGIERARLALVTVPAAVDAWSVSTRIRALNPTVPLIVRSDSLQEAEALLSLGALNIVQPEFEAALEMAREALLALDLEEDVQQEILRSEREARFRERG
jgi:CPA2 family monovalent cation:H+ antiporter-2